MSQVAPLPKPSRQAATLQGHAEPVTWTVTTSRTQVPRDLPFQLRLQAAIAPGYHLYSVTQAPGGPIPTSITLPPGQPFTLTWPHPSFWPQPVKVFDPKFEMETEYHVGNVIFDLEVNPPAEAAPGSHDLVVRIGYQICDEHTCLRPEAKELRVPIEVAASPAGGDKHSSETAKAKTDSETATLDAAQERLQQILKGPASQEREAELWRLVKDYPKFVFAYNVLAKPFLARGDFRGATAVYRKGLAADPRNDALHASMLGCSGKPAVRLRAVQQFVRRFSRSLHTSRFLLELAASAPSRAARLKLMRRAAAADKSLGALVSTSALCWELALSDPQGAAKLMEKWASAATRNAAKGQETSYMIRDLIAARRTFFGAIAKVDRLIKSRKHQAAVAAAQQLSEPEVPYFGVDDRDRVLLALTRAQALVAAGQPQEAYEGLVGHALLLTSDELLEAAVRIGRKLGKSRRQVEDEAWAGKLRGDNNVAHFELPAPRGRTIKAEDFRGRVLLVNVWNPG